MSDARNLNIARRISVRFSPHWRRSYVYHKLRIDPVYRAVSEAVAAEPGDLLDIGCGLGLLGQYLRECKISGRYVGIDIDEAKIACAKTAAAEVKPPLEFRSGRLDAASKLRGHVFLLDVLHYLTTAEQSALLADCARCVAPGAMLIVRNVVRQPGWRFRITVWEEKFMRAVGWMRTPVRDYPTRQDIEGPLLAAGLEPETRPLWGDTPFNSFLILARRRGDNASA